MWCFFDESLNADAGVAAVFACLMRDESVNLLEKVMYRARHTHYGRSNAKNLEFELKGKSLLSNYSFRQIEKHGTKPTNHELVDDILRYCILAKPNQLAYMFGAVIYADKPSIKSLREKRLDRPFKDILNAVSAAACQLETKRTVKLVFDQQLGSDQRMSIATKQFVAGVQLPNVSNYPLYAVSNVSPGVQLADIGAYILQRRASGDSRFIPWLNNLRKLEWSGVVEGRSRDGILRYELTPDGKFKKCHKWQEIC